MSTINSARAISDSGLAGSSRASETLDTRMRAIIKASNSGRSTSHKQKRCSGELEGRQSGPSPGAMASRKTSADSAGSRELPGAFGLASSPMR
eukprot:scaffold187676_cov26-Tisochrysis_lutea.AAC.7